MKINLSSNESVVSEKCNRHVILIKPIVVAVCACVRVRLYT